MKIIRNPDLTLALLRLGAGFPDEIEALCKPKVKTTSRAPWVDRPKINRQQRRAQQRKDKKAFHHG